MKGRAVVIALALLLDLVAGDPPNRFHPTAWMGTAIGEARRRAPKSGRAWPFAFGAALAVSGAALVGSLGLALERLTALLPAPLSWLAQAAVLKTTLSWRGLQRAARDVAGALPDDLPEARRRLSWHLVSRDTRTLAESQVAAATIESVAENTSDSIIAPLLYYAQGGLAAALAYRFLNTGDAMLGYRDEEREWLGKAPARLDDVANLLPARLSALLLTFGARLSGEDAAGAWRIWRRDAGKTASPNAGHPMSAMAGALGVELEKVGHYTLGGGQRPATAHAIARSIRVMNTAIVLGGAACTALALLIASRSERGKR